MSEKKITLILGKRGSGKSYLANKLIENEPRLVIFDVMSEYKNGVVFDAENYDLFLEFWRKVYVGRFRIIYQPIKPDDEIEKIGGSRLLLFVSKYQRQFCRNYSTRPA